MMAKMIAKEIKIILRTRLKVQGRLGLEESFEELDEVGMQIKG